jgi:iron complex outermembrane recepter protein
MHPITIEKSPSKRAKFSFVAAFILTLALSAKAQTESTAKPAEATEDSKAPIVLDRYYVLGSNIPSAGDAPVAPVQIMSQAKISDSGVSNDLLEVIRKIAPQFSGNSNLGGGNGNIDSGSTNGGSALALRNTTTLVLVNGRRLANAPVAATGGSVFVDVNSIPLAAIEKIEILTDGASAIYGADAVAGVVNITLKSDFEGFLVGGRYASSRNDGKYSEKSAYGVAGGKNDKGTKITASYEWTKTDPLYNGQRAFSSPSYGTTNFAGVIQTGHYEDGTFIGEQYYYLDPSLSAPKAGATLEERGYTKKTVGEILRLFDLSKYVTQRIGNDKKIGTVNIEQRLGNVTAFGDFIYTKTDNTSQLNAQPVSVKMAADNPNNILGVDVSVRNRFISLPRTYNNKTDSFRGVVGLKGDISDNWNFEGALNMNRASQDFSNGGLVRTAGRIDAVNSGKIDLFSRVQSAGALDGVFGAAQGHYVSTLNSIDFKVAGVDLINLPGGGVGLAAGGEMRKEKLTANSDIDSQSATFAYDDGTSIDPFSATRNIGSLFLETRVPLVGKENRIPAVYAASITAAVRHEIYDDGDDPTVPKFALSYQPFDDSLLFRATISRSFAAPSIFNLHSPNGIGYTAQLAEFDGNQANILTTPVTGLKPSKSRNISVGFVWTPAFIKSLSLSVDFFDIKQAEVISNYNATGVIDAIFHDVEVNGAASPYAKLIHIGDFTGPTVSAPGQISSYGLDNIYYVIPAASNLGSQKLRGADIKISYTQPLGSYGKLIFDSSSTYYSNYDIQSAPGFEYTKTAGLVTGLNGSIAKFRTYNTITYKLKGFAAMLANTYYTSMKDTTWTVDSVADGYYERIPSYSTFDATLSYEFTANRSWFNSVKVTLGVDNIGNRMPTKSATYDGLSNADIDEFNPVGRMYYVSGEYRF